MGLLDAVFGRASRVFMLNNAKLQPAEYGTAVAKWVSQSSPERAKQLIALGERHGASDSLFARVGSQPVHAQAHLIAFESASYLFHSASLPGVTNTVRDEIASGMAAAFQAGMGSLGPALTYTIGTYYAKLRDELLGAKEDQGFDVGSGPTAVLVYNNIVDAYQSFAPVSGLPPVEVDAMDALLIQRFIKGIVATTFTAQQQMNFRYVP